MKKRIIAVLMSFALVLSMTACGESKEATNAYTESKQETQVEASTDASLNESAEASLAAEGSSSEASEAEISSTESIEESRIDEVVAETSESYIPIASLSSFEELEKAMERTFSNDFTMSLDMSKLTPEYPISVIFCKNDTNFIVSMKNKDREFMIAADENNSGYAYLSFTANDGVLKQKAKGTNSSESISASQLAEEFGMQTDLDDKYTVEKIDDNNYKLYENGEYSMTCIIEDGYLTKIKRSEVAEDGTKIDVELDIKRDSADIEFNPAEFEEVDAETFTWSLFGAIMYLAATDEMLSELDNGYMPTDLNDN